MKYQPKATKAVDARQFTGDLDASLEKWLGNLHGAYRPAQNGLPAELRVQITPNQTATARPGDWIVKSSETGVHVYTSEAFGLAYEEVPPKGTTKEAKA